MPSVRNAPLGPASWEAVSLLAGQPGLSASGTQNPRWRGSARRARAPGQLGRMGPGCLRSPVSLFSKTVMGFRACSLLWLLDVSLLLCFSFLTRWPVQEGLDPDSVLSTLFSPPSFSLCLVGAGQFHLLHVSVSVLLVSGEACLPDRGAPPAHFCSPDLSPASPLS